ncbi:MAG: sulfite exporter TauE/SafE family protein, partial [Acidimicrobiales bacterium]
GILLVNFPNAFQTIVPILIIIAVILVVAQPSIARRLAKGGHHGNGGLLMYIGIFLTAIYGGYFGAAQGVILLAILGIGFEDTLQRLNGLKNVIAAVVNGVAAILFLFVAHIAFIPAVIIAISSALGAQFGAKVGRRIPSKALRGLIVVVGLAVAIKLLFF